MSLEKSIDNLADAMRENTVALLAQSESVNNMMSDTPAAETEKPVTSKKAAVKAKADKKKAAAAKTPDPVKTEGAAISGEIEETPASEEVVLTADGVQKHLRAVASQLTDTSKLFGLIQKHGGQQFSDLDPSVYSELVAEADALVEAGA